MISFLMALFISYPSIAWFACDLNMMAHGEMVPFVTFFVCRFFYIWLVIYLMNHYNARKLYSTSLGRRMLPNALLGLSAFVVYEVAKLMAGTPYDLTRSIPFFQYAVASAMVIGYGYITFLYKSREEKESELLQLRIESLQSRCNALTNQINPHFFFNSLNGISSLVRTKDAETTIGYISELSDIFRYILQSENKGLVTLEEELDFVKAYIQVLKVRYAHKLNYEIEVDTAFMQKRLPVLAVLPVIENVTVHNMIDSDHIMSIRIGTTTEGELQVSNSYYPKAFKAETHGTGLKNLQKRYTLLMNKEIHATHTDTEFCVTLPLS